MIEGLVMIFIVVLFFGIGGMIAYSLFFSFLTIHYHQRGYTLGQSFDKARETLK